MSGKWLQLLLLPGILSLGLIVDQRVLAPRRELRTPSEELLHWQRHAESNPDFVLAHQRLAMVQESLRDWKSAQRSFARALEIDADHHEAAIGLAGALRQQGRGQAAKTHMEAFLARNPDCSPCAFSLAVDLFALDDFERAEAVIDQAMAGTGADRDERWDDMWVLAGRIQVARGRRANAAKLFSSVLERNPDHLEALLNAGGLNLRDDVDLAFAQLSRYRELDPDDPAGAVMLARANWMRGDLGEASDLLTKAEAALPGTRRPSVDRELRSHIQHIRRQISARVRSNDRRESADTL